jgi:hypothetical protein
VFVHRLAEPIDEFDGLTPLPEWLRDATPHAACWAMQALLALADAGPHIGWRGDMRHLPAVGALPTPPAATAFLVVKQDDNGITFVITTAEGSSLATGVAATIQVVPRDIGLWAPPTSHDYASLSTQTDRPPDHPTAIPF